MNRIENRFNELKEQKRAGLVTFITAGDPDMKTCGKILEQLNSHGADFIELGMPFSDPVADGPIIQAASERALTAGATLRDTLQLVKSWRVNDPNTPIILMGYYNPIYSYGTDRFVKKARECGVDGLIIVDLPPEEDMEMYEPARKADISIIRLVTPATTEERLGTILERADGFIYYVSITGITGTGSGDRDHIQSHISKIRQSTSLPIAIGFGINTADDVRQMSEMADAVVVGSTIVNMINDISNGAKNFKDLDHKINDLANGLRKAS